MFKSKNKKTFFKQNIFDLLAIIPVNSLFRVFRIFRVLRIIKFVKILKILKLERFVISARVILKKIDGFVKTNGFVYVLYSTIITLLAGAVGIYFAEYEKTINSIGDALWWAFVTITTVGYGDISPSAVLGRIIAVILMIVGIGFIGMLTGTIATYILNIRKINE